MLKFILLGLLGLVVLFMITAALQPADFRITRSATLSAPPAVIFEQINDLHKMNAWSPWARLDPNAKHSFEGAPAGVGAGLAWTGNKEVGEGRMTITESKPNEQIVMRLEFLKPFTATNRAEFTLKPMGDQTMLTWSMAGQNGFLLKAMGLLMNCEKMIGGQFEQGFANLKSIIESPVKI